MFLCKENLCYNERKEGMHIKVHVTAGAKNEGIERKNADTYIVAVREKSERGMANKRVCELLADYFESPAGQVRIISGGLKPHKIIFIP